jgi:hypothetical protein
MKSHSTKLVLSTARGNVSSDGETRRVGLSVAVASPVVVVSHVRVLVVPLLDEPGIGPTVAAADRRLFT